MKALRRHPNALQLDDLEPRRLRTLDVRIAVALAGICRTDSYVAAGKIPVNEPRVLGHEFCGIVTESNSPRFQIGDHVTAEPFVGADMIGVQIDGAFAEEIVLPDSLIHRVPEAMDPRAAAYVEPVAASLAPLNANLRGEGYVFGDGRIHQLTVAVLAASGVPFSSGLDVDQRFDWVIETSADPERLNQALRLVKKGGTLVLKSRPSGLVPFDVAYAVKHEIKIQGVHYGSFPDAIHLLSERLIDVDHLFGGRFQLAEFDAAFTASNAEQKKVFFQIGDW